MTFLQKPTWHSNRRNCAQKNPSYQNTWIQRAAGWNVSVRQKREFLEAPICAIREQIATCILAESPYYMYSGRRLLTLCGPNVQTPVVNKCMINIWYVVLSKAVYFIVKSSIVWYVNMRQMPNAHSELYPISIAWYVFGMNAVPFSTLDKGNPKANGLLHKWQLCSQISPCCLS